MHTEVVRRSTAPGGENSQESRNNGVPQGDVDNMSSDDNSVPTGLSNLDNTRILSTSTMPCTDFQDFKRGRRPFLCQKAIKRLISLACHPEGVMVRMAYPGKKMDPRIKFVVWEEFRQILIREGYIPKSAVNTISTKFLMVKWYQLRSKYRKLKAEQIRDGQPPSWEFWDDMENYQRSLSSISLQNAEKMTEDGTATSTEEILDVTANEKYLENLIQCHNDQHKRKRCASSSHGTVAETTSPRCVNEAAEASSIIVGSSNMQYMCNRLLSCFDHINKQRKQTDAFFLAESSILFDRQLKEFQAFATERCCEVRKQFAELHDLLQRVEALLAKQRR